MFSFVSASLFSLPKLFAPMLSFSRCYFNGLPLGLVFSPNSRTEALFLFCYSSLINLQILSDKFLSLPRAHWSACPPPWCLLILPRLHQCFHFVSPSPLALVPLSSFFHSLSAAKLFCALIPLHTYCALKPIADLSLSLPLLLSNVPQLHTSSMSSRIYIFWNWGPVYIAMWV